MLVILWPPGVCFAIHTLDPGRVPILESKNKPCSRIRVEPILNGLLPRLIQFLIFSMALQIRD